MMKGVCRSKEGTEDFMDFVKAYDRVNRKSVTDAETV